eukprot:SAG22_NODE_2897_length_2118_cov_2.553739_1_plen_298_part_00
MAQKWPPDPLTVLRGHTADVNALAFGTPATGDAEALQLLVSGDNDGHMRVWNMATRRTSVQVDAAHNASLLHFAFVGDGCTQLLSQSKDNTVKLWDLQHSSSSSSSSSSDGCGGNGSAGAAAVTAVSTLENHDHSFCRMAVYDPTNTAAAAAEQRWAGGGTAGAEGEPAPEAAGGGGDGGGTPAAAAPAASAVGSAVLVALAFTDTNDISFWDTRLPTAGTVVKHRHGDGGTGAKSGQCMSLLLHDGGRLLLGGYEDGSVDCYDLVAGRWRPEAAAAAASRKMHGEPVLGLTTAVLG